LANKIFHCSDAQTFLKIRKVLQNQNAKSENFCEIRKFLNQKIFAKSENFCEIRKFLQKQKIFAKTENFCKIRKFFRFFFQKKRFKRTPDQIFGRCLLFKNQLKDTRKLNVFTSSSKNKEDEKVRPS